MSAPSDLISVNIDGKEIAVPKGTNMIQAASLLGIEIPHYCYHPKLSVPGNCRMCLVEMGMPATDPKTRAPILDEATGKPKISWMPRPTIGCGTTAAPGLHIRTNTESVKQMREGVMEFLLVNHPLDCPICDQAGECRLQEFAFDYGRGSSRFVERKNVKPKRTVLGPRVVLDDERCILCSRCIRFCKEVAKDDVLGFTERGSYSTLSCYPGKQLENNYSLNTVDICPVGALTSNDFRFKMRVWFLKQTNSICTESSVGANTVVWSREGEIYRITPRQNDEVNDTWMADSGRELYKQVGAPDRLRVCRSNNQPIAAAEALAQAAALLKAGPVAIVGSGRCSVEEQFLLKKLAEALGAKAHLVSRVGEGDQLLISADRNPNVRGALVTGLISELPSATLNALGADLDAGRIKTVLAVNEDLLAAGLTREQLAKAKVVYLGSRDHPTAGLATVAIAGLTVFEKSGCFINQQFRIQKFDRAIPSPEGAVDDLLALATMVAEASGRETPSTLASLWPVIAGEVSLLAGVSHQSLPEGGLLLDRSRFAGLPFIEGESLHFKPAAQAATV
jgi:NADH-quinone oxidoreductase subunit G